MLPAQLFLLFFLFVKSNSEKQENIHSNFNDNLRGSCQNNNYDCNYDDVVQKNGKDGDKILNDDDDDTVKNHDDDTVQNHDDDTVLNHDDDTVQNHDDDTVQKSSENGDRVQNHYATLPFPPFSSEDMEKEKIMYRSIHEEKIPIYTPRLFLEMVNHYLFQGKQNFRSKFRVLVAGGGTGAFTLFLAEQLNHTNAQIVHFDFSKPSIEIAQERARIRGLTNLVWIRDWIENIPKLGLGKFDLIECRGVLHHLKDPDVGLSVLSNSLTDQGGITMMVYGRYGRTGVYQMQDLMSLVNIEEVDIEIELDNTKKIIEALPISNKLISPWFHQFNQDIKTDHINSELYDLFLHKRDVSYTVSDIYRFARSHGLHLLCWEEPTVRGNLLVDSYVNDPHLLKQIKKRTTENQEAISELLSGDLSLHAVYASKIQNSEADINDLDNVVYLQSHVKGLRPLLANMADNATVFTANVSGFGVVANGDARITWPMGKKARKLLGILFRSGKRLTLKELFETFRKIENSKVSDKKLLREFKELYFYAKMSGQLLLKKKHVEDFPKTKFLNLYTFTAIDHRQNKF